MNNSSLISVLIPAFQSKASLKTAVESALRQKYEHLELIVSDDGTPGFDASEIESFAASVNDRVSCVVLSQKKNLGTVANLNCALAHAHGAWIQLLAADDMFASPESVGDILTAAMDRGSVWALPLTTLCDAQMRLTGRVVPENDVLALLRGGALRRLYFRNCLDCVLPAEGIFQRNVLEQVGGFDVAYRLIEDWPLSLKLLQMGFMPGITERACILHRGGGVSRRSPQHNRLYQTDLIHVMQREILPHLEQLEEQEREAVWHRCEEKAAVYKLRFECRSPLEKLSWSLRHSRLLLRKARKRYYGS